MSSLKNGKIKRGNENGLVPQLSIYLLDRDRVGTRAGQLVLQFSLYCSNLCHVTEMADGRENTDMLARASYC